MPIPLAFMDSSVIEEIPLELWRQTFDSIGWPTPLQDKREGFTHDDILDAIERDAVSTEFKDALETVHALGTNKGREAIDGVLAERRVFIGDIPKGLGAREFALHLFLRQRTDGAIAETLVRAHVQLEQGKGRRYSDFAGKQPKRLRNLKTCIATLEHDTREYCAQKDLGDHVEVQMFDHDDGTYRFRVMRSHHTQSQLVVMPGSTKGRGTIKLTPVHSDLVRYEPSLGRLRIAARAPSTVEFYRKAFGRAFFGDETFFYGAAVCDLRVLQDRGRAALDVRDVEGVGRIWMTDCVWERGDGKRVQLHDTEDCFDTIDELKLPFKEGELLEAKLKIQVAGKSTRPIVVTVRPPSRIEPNHNDYEALVNEVLDKIEIRHGARGVPETTLWNIHPWRTHLEVWREVFPGETDRLVRAGVLKPVMLRAVESPDHAGAGHVLEAVRIGPGEFHGRSGMEEVPSRALSATDLEALELDVPKLQAHLRELLGISGNAVPWTPDQALLDLGVLKIEQHSLHVSYALREPPPNAAAIVRDRAASIPAALLLPVAGATPCGVPEVLLDRPLPSPRRAISAMLFKTGLAAQVPALFTAPEGARLIVDLRFGCIWFDGVLIAELTAGTQHFRYVEIVARASPRAIDSGEVSKQISNRDDGDQVARTAKTNANKSLQKAMRAAGHKFVSPFQAKGGTHRATVLCHVAE
jgi:hypothetical protein